MILVIYFDIFRKDLEKQLNKHNIPFQLVKYADLEHYKPVKLNTPFLIENALPSGLGVSSAKSNVAMRH